MSVSLCQPQGSGMRHGDPACAGGGRARERVWLRRRRVLLRGVRLFPPSLRLGKPPASPTMKTTPSRKPEQRVRGSLIRGGDPSSLWLSAARAQAHRAVNTGESTQLWSIQWSLEAVRGSEYLNPLPKDAVTRVRSPAPFCKIKPLAKGHGGWKVAGLGQTLFYRKGLFLSTKGSRSPRRRQEPQIHRVDRVQNTHTCRGDRRHAVTSRS